MVPASSRDFARRVLVAFRTEPRKYFTRALLAGGPEFLLCWLSAFGAVAGGVGCNPLTHAVASYGHRFLVIDLQATMFAKLTAERFELRRRDYALATDIGDAIVRDATLVETTAISLPRYVPATHYRALVLPVFDSGVSAFDKLWSQAEIITLATGLKLTRVAPPRALGVSDPI